MKKYLETVRNHCPLVHNITNYVTVNDVANITPGMVVPRPDHGG